MDFANRIVKMLQNYNEIRLVFDIYILNARWKAELEKDGTIIARSRNFNK